MVGIDSGGSTRYWKFNGKTYYSYAAWKKASDTYAAQQAAAKRAADAAAARARAAEAARRKAAAQKRAAPAPRRTPASAPSGPSAAQQAALAAQARQRQAAWQKEQQRLLARRQAERRKALEQQALARRLAEQRRQMAELQRRKADAAKAQQAKINTQLARIKAEEQKAIARTYRSQTYANLAQENAAKLTRLQTTQGQRLDAVSSPLRTLSGRQELYTQKMFDRRKPVVLGHQGPFRGGPKMLDQANAQDKQNEQIVNRARSTGNWDSVIDTLESQSKASGGRFHDEALYQAIQREYIAPIMKIDEDAKILLTEYDEALEAGDDERLAELAEEARPLMEQHAKFFGDGIKPGKAARVMQVMTDMGRRRDRIWLATIGVGGASLGGYSEEAIDALAERARKKGEVQRGAQVRSLEGEERGLKKVVTGPLAYYRSIRDAEGRPVNIVEFGVDAYIARERAREQVRMRDAYSATAMGERAMITSGMEQVRGRNGNLVWRRKDVGDALERAADTLGLTDQQFMGRFDNVMQEDDPAVQEVELRRLLDEIQNEIKREWERENGANYTGRDMKGGTSFRARRDQYIKQRMDTIVYGLTGVKGGGISYDGAWVPPIGHILPALQDPVNDVVNHWRDFVEPGVARQGDFYSHRADDGWWNSKVGYRTSVVGSADPKSPDYDPTIAREYARWLKNRDHEDGDVRSAANRRWRQVQLTGNVSFVADVVVDPLNALGLLTKPLQAARLVGRTAPMVGKFTGMPIGPQGAVGRFAQYMTPQFQSRKVAGWQNMINYHHVRMDQVRVNTARELGVPIKQILNYSDGDWEEFARVRNMGEEAIGDTQIGKDLFATAGVNRTQVMSVLQTRLPQIMRRYGVSFTDPAERARQLQHIQDSRKWADSQTQTVEELERKMVENADQIRALRTVRNRRGNRSSAEHIADLDQRINRLQNERIIAQRRLEDLEQENAARAWAHRRRTGMSDEASEELMTIEAQEAALTGGNPMAARKLQDRIALVQDSIRKTTDESALARYRATLADLEDRLQKLPGIEDRRQWHRVQKAKRELMQRVEQERRAQGIYTHYNNPGRMKQLKGQLRKEVNARATSAWGGKGQRGKGMPSVFGRALYLSGDDSVWRGFPKMIKRPVREGGKSKSKGGGVMKSNKVAGKANVREEIRWGQEKLTKGFFQLNPGTRAGIVTIGNIRELRAAFKRFGVGKFTGANITEELAALADALRAQGYLGIEITGLANKSKSAAWRNLRTELRGDTLALFNPEQAGSWIDDAADAPIDLTDARRLVEEADQGIDDLTRARARADADYKAGQKAPVRDDVVSSATLKIGVENVDARPPIGGKILRYITRELKPPRGMKGKPGKGTRLSVKVEVETTYDQIVRDLSETTTEYRKLLELAERDMDIVSRADELVKIPGPSGIDALRKANQRLKKTLKEMSDYEDRIVYEANWPGSAAPSTVAYPGETTAAFNVRKARAKVLGQNVPKEPYGPRPLKPVERKGLITRRMEALGSYHRAVGGDPFAPSFVDTTLTKIAEDRKWLRGLERDLEFRIQNAKSEAQAEVFMRELAQIQEAQKGLEIEYNFVDKGRTVARKYAVERLDRIRPAVRPQRLAHLARDEQGRLFGASDDLNRRLRRIEDVLDEGDRPRLSAEVRANLEKVVVRMEKTPANRIEVRPGVSKTQRHVIRLENAVGQGELNLFEAYVITNSMMRDGALRAVWRPTHRMLERRIMRMAEDIGISDLKFRDISDFIGSRHLRMDLPTDVVYTLYKQIDQLTAAELERVRGFRAEGQVPVAGGKPKKPSKYRTLNAHDTDPMVIGAKLKIAKQTGVDMFVYDEMRSVFGDIMLRENRARELLEQAEALAKKNGTTVDEEFLRLRQLRAEEEAVRAFEEFATRPEFQGMPMERVLRVFEERHILKDMSVTPPLRVNRLQKELLEAAWKEITGFDYADEAARADWLQMKKVDITDPQWIRMREEARAALAEDDAARRANLAELLKVREINRKRAARALPVMARDITESIPHPGTGSSNDLGTKASIQQLWDDPVPGAPHTRPGYLYHGTPFNNKESWIDASGNLHIRGSDDAIRKGVPWAGQQELDPRLRKPGVDDRGAFLSPYPGNSTTFKEGLTSGGVAEPDGGFLFEIDFRAFPEDSLYRNPSHDSRRTLSFDDESAIDAALSNVDLDEIIYRGDLIVPKGAFRVYAKDPNTPVDIEKLIGWTDEAQAWSEDDFFEFLTNNFMNYEDDFAQWMAEFRKPIYPSADPDILYHELLRRIDQVDGFEERIRERWLKHDKSVEQYYVLKDADEAERAARAAAGDPFAWERANDAAEDMSELARREMAIKDSHLDYFDSVIDDARKAMQAGTYRPVDVGEMAQLVPTKQKHSYIKVEPKLQRTYTRAQRRRVEARLEDPRRTLDPSTLYASPPPLHRRDLMREWLVKEGRWDPQTGEDIRLGRRPWSVDEERAFYEDNFGMTPIWTDDDWLAIVLRDQRAYQRAFREVGFSDEAFEALADGQVIDPQTGEITMTGEKIRGKKLAEAMVWGKKGFKAQRSLAELREWAIGRYGDRVATNGKFHTMPWLMKLDHEEYFPWLRRALGMEARVEFRELLERTKDKMDPYLKSQYFDDAGDLRALGLDIDPTLLGAKNPDDAEKLLDNLRQGLFDAMEARVARMKHKNFAVEGEWMGQELLAFSYDVMSSMMTSQAWRGAFRGRTLLQQLLHMAGWQRAIVSFNPAFGIMNLFESFGYKRGLLAAIHNNFVPMSVTGQQYAHLIPTLDVIDKNASRLFGLEGKAKFGARTMDGGLAPGLRFRGAVDDLANWGAHASKWGEERLRLDFARVMAGQAYETALHQGMGRGAAKVFAQMHAKRMLDVYFASIGDNAVMMAFNQLIPFFSYRLKQMTLAVTMSVKHPWIPLFLGKIQQAVIDANRALWIKEHGSEEGFNPNDIRSHSLWIEIDGQFYGLDLWDVSDWTRAMRGLVRRGTTGGRVQDFVGDFLRVPHPLQLGIWAALTGGVTPWGKPGDWREVFWFVDVAQWMMGKDYENPRWKRDALQMGTQLFFFSGFNKITETDQAVMTFYAMKEAGDNKAAQEYFDRHPEIQAYFDSTEPFRKPRWDPYNGRSASWYANLDDATRDEYNTLYEEFNSLVKKLDEEIFKYAAAPWSEEYRAARKMRNLVLTQWHVENPLLSRMWALEVPYKEFVRLQQDWLVDGQVDTWFHLLNQKPKKTDFKTDLEYAQALVKFNELKSTWLDAHPAVMTRLYDSNNALVKAWHDQELHWSEVLDFQARINLRIIEEEEKEAGADEDLIDLLYQVKNDASQLLDAEAYAFVNESLVPGTSKTNRNVAARIAAAAWGGDMGRLKSAIQIPGFADYRYGNASPEERTEMLVDMQYYDELGSLAEQMKKYRDEPFSDKNDWWGQLKKRGLLDRYLKENPHKKDDYEYVVAIGNIITNYGKNFWSGLMEPGNKWLLDEYLSRNPEKRAQYNFMRGLDQIWKTIGTDYTRFYSELAKVPWLEAEYFRRNPDKANRGAKSAYALAMGKLVNSATSGADFYAKLNANPWLRDEYFRRHPEKMAQMQANEAYIKALQPWIAALKRDDFVAAQKAWDAMPAWARERYLSKNPGSGMADGMGGGQRPSTAVEYKGQWFKSAASRDKYIKWIEGGRKGAQPPADGSAPTFRNAASRARYMQGQQYYAGIGGWVELLKKKDYVGAKKYFDALPVWMKEKYWAKHPDQRAKMQLDQNMLADGAQYFLAAGSDKDKVLARNPELMRWLQEHGGDEAKHRGLIIAMYRAIPSKEPWLKRTFRERFPEVFSEEAAGERTMKKIARKLAENPDMLPYYEKAVKLQYEIYEKQLRLDKKPPMPWTMERKKRNNKRRRKRAAAFSSHYGMHKDVP